MIQIDNQLRFAVYPVLLSSSYPHAKLDVVEGIARTGRELKASEGASLTLLIAKWRRPAGSVDCFQCISLGWFTFTLFLDVDTFVTVQLM